MKLKLKWLKVLTVALAMGSLVATGSQAAVTQLEGQAGGGIVPWALLSGGTPTASMTWVDTGDYTLSSLAVQGTLFKRVELSYARLTFDTGHVGLGQVNVDAFGAKIKVCDMAAGFQPAVALGVLYKKTDLDDGVLNALGADDSGTDFYVAAAKVFPVAGKNVLLNVTIRATKANQIGILGFGGTDDDNYSVQAEGSLGVFLNKQTVLGVEYRMKPDNIKGVEEDDWADIFIAYFPNKNMSIVAAYADLGDIVKATDLGQTGDAGKDQRGLYLQIQANF
ncbi:Hypothetical protein in Cyanoglobin locus [hydrothermal vent metagenome]|uniref:DUF3034 family protein n=1 Tax=hydrothermal vent metagenome TaxID=652676 RepID=A0A3B0VSR9_9ZZZZ